MFKKSSILVLGNPIVAQVMRSIGDAVYVPTATKKTIDIVQEVALVVFTGGSDVHPKYYGHTKHVKSNVSEYRDQVESEIFTAAAKGNVPMVGICRGAQLLTALNGGTLYQDVNQHIGDHPIVLRCPSTGADITMQASSTHHQMMNPFGLPEDEYIILGRTVNALSTHYDEHIDGAVVTNNVPDVEPEAVYYPYTNSFAFQPHPEYQSSTKYDAMRKTFLKYCEFMMEDSLSLTRLGLGERKLDSTKLINVELTGNVRGE